MVRTIAAALLCSGCTLVVDHQLSANPGGCSDLIFSDGTPTGGQRFHSGVSAVSFRGPAYPAAGKTPANFASTLAFLFNGALEQASGLDSDTILYRPETNFTPTWVGPGPGHEGPQSFGCAEMVAATYDSLRDRTSLQLLAAGCADDFATDGGTWAGAPAALSPATGWALGADGGAMIATVLGGQGQVCPETFPASCFPPHGGAVASGGTRQIDALTDAQGQPVWIVATEGADTRLYDVNFGGSIGVVSWSGPIAVVAPDLGIVMRIQSGELQAQLFDVTGAKRGSEFHTTLGDSGAHGLEIARFGTSPILRAAWIGGDGRARVATFDVTVAANPRLGTQSIVCGAGSVSFVAPMSSTTAAVLVGDALYLRHVD